MLNKKTYPKVLIKFYLQTGHKQDFFAAVATGSHLNVRKKNTQYLEEMMSHISHRCTFLRNTVQQYIFSVL